MAEKSFLKYGIVPEVIPHAPKDVLKVTYEDGHEVNLGAVLTPRQVKDQPKVTWTAENGALYTLAFVDPDAPSRNLPNKKECEHWLVINISGNDLEKGETLSPYHGAGAPEKTGFHRYIFLLFKQTGRISDKKREGPTREEMIRQRIGYIRDFAQKHGLGAPIAGNFFQAEFDDYVAEQRKARGEDEEAHKKFIEKMLNA